MFGNFLNEKGCKGESNLKKKFWKKITITLLVLVLVRLCAYIPVIGVREDALKIAMSQYDGMFQLMNQMTGNAFQNMTITGLGITPYITATIVLQLLMVSFDTLGNAFRDGYAGKKKREMCTLVLGVFMSIVIALASAITLGKLGYLIKYHPLSVGMVALCLCLGEMLLIGAGKIIDKKGVGNGISLILGINILSTFPSDVKNILSFSKKNLIITGILLFIIISVILFMELTRKEIPVRSTVRLEESKKNEVFQTLPIKLNLCNVMPIIFVSTLMQICSLLAPAAPQKGMIAKILGMFTTSEWFVSKSPYVILGMVVYCLVVIGSGFLYADMAMNLIETSSYLKSNRCYLLGVRPGNDTVDYLRKQRRSMVLCDILLLLVLSLCPIVVSNLLGISLQMSGTSLIIVCGVFMEGKRAIRAEYYSTRYLKEWDRKRGNHVREK